MPPDVIVERITTLTPDQMKQIIALFPDDDLKRKRMSNLSKAKYVLIAKINEAIAGVLFIRDILFIPNATWIVGQSFQRQGIAFKLLRQAQRDFLYITAISRNVPSINLAKKAGLIVFPFGVGFWIRRRAH